MIIIRIKEIKHKGILTLNPELCEKELILYVNESPEWMNSNRQN